MNHQIDINLTEQTKTRCNRIAPYYDAMEAISDGCNGPHLKLAFNPEPGRYPRPLPPFPPGWRARRRPGFFSRNRSLPASFKVAVSSRF